MRFETNIFRPAALGMAPFRAAGGTEAEAAAYRAAFLLALGAAVWWGGEAELIGEIPGLLQIDGLVAAVLVELGAPYFV
jgi:hypothetical protein